MDTEPDPLNESMVSMATSFYNVNPQQVKKAEFEKEFYEKKYSSVLEILTELQKDKMIKETLK